MLVFKIILTLYNHRPSNTYRLLVLQHRQSERQIWTSYCTKYFDTDHNSLKYRLSLFNVLSGNQSKWKLIFFKSKFSCIHVTDIVSIEKKNYYQNINAIYEIVNNFEQLSHDYIQMLTKIPLYSLFCRSLTYFAKISISHRVHDVILFNWRHSHIKAHLPFCKQIFITENTDSQNKSYCWFYVLISISWLLQCMDGWTHQ